MTTRDDILRDLTSDSVDFIETHISWVVLRETDVLKIKKPVDLGFLDFSTLELRKAACEREVELNRRLAPDVYLGVVPLRLVDGHLSLEGDEEVLEDRKSVV